MQAVLNHFDFLPQSLGHGLRLFVYLMIVLHLAALIFWAVIACPSMFKTSKKNSIRDIIETAKNK